MELKMRRPVSGVARQKYHLNSRFSQQYIDIQEFFDEMERLAGLQDVVFVGDLILPVGFQAVGLENGVAVAQVEQRPGADGHRQRRDGDDRLPLMRPGPE
jgi:hypothetical protein